MGGVGGSSIGGEPPVLADYLMKGLRYAALSFLAISSQFLCQLCIRIPELNADG